MGRNRNEIKVHKAEGQIIPQVYKNNVLSGFAVRLFRDSGDLMLVIFVLSPDSGHVSRQLLRTNYFGIQQNYCNLSAEDFTFA